MRNKELESEMQVICSEIWPQIGKAKYSEGLKKMPTILSKQGGSSGCYYPSQHTVYFRWNVWNKLTLAGKRMLALHELYHATGRHHKGSDMYLHAFDILTIELYKKIYGEDSAYRELLDKVGSQINN